MLNQMGTVYFDHSVRRSMVSSVDLGWLVIMDVYQVTYCNIGNRLTAIKNIIKSLIPLQEVVSNVYTNQYVSNVFTSAFRIIS